MEFKINVKLFEQVSLHPRRQIVKLQGLSIRPPKVVLPFCTF
jgi:hypothetical protein